ncbi:MAG: DUF4290 domain-containing protein [Bacteroidetes bacterium]|nr:DUF4290 domain-containing protein [Bacteroidota bacterium]
MSILQEDYNTNRESLAISEYGRHIQQYIQHLQSLPTREERTKWAHAVINVMTVLNPEVKLQSNYKEKLWGHLYQISGYNLDVDSPYPLLEAEERNHKPRHIGYNDTVIKFRFYGRNLQNMVDTVAELENGELKQDMVNLIASFMFNSCKNWNNENLSNEVIAEHLKVLSRGKLNLNAEELVVSQDTSQPQRRFFNNQGGGQNNRNKNKNNKFKRGGGKGNFRRY